MSRAGAIWACWLAVAAGTTFGQDPPPLEPTPRPSLATRPYLIKMWMGRELSARMDAPARDRLIEDWRKLVQRFIGAPWEVEIAGDPGPLSGGVSPDSIEAATLTRLFAPADDWDWLIWKLPTPPLDKAWLVQIAGGATGGAFTFSSREYDVTTQRLGPTFHETATHPGDAARALFRLTWSMFCPLAEVGESAAGKVALNIQGGMLTPASPLGAVAVEGSVFRPIRANLLRDGSLASLQDIPWSYLRVVKFEEGRASCQIVSALTNPLAKARNKNKMWALGVKSAATPTPLQFVTGEKNPRPLAGYTLMAKDVAQGTTMPLGLTDREGRINVDPRIVNRLARLQLISGDVEPLAEFPLVPGEGGPLRIVKIDPKGEVLEYHSRLNALNDEVVDLIAQRSRLTAILAARAEAKNWSAVAAYLKEYDKLPQTAPLKSRLETMKARAEKAQRESKAQVMTKTVHARFEEVKALIERYLDDANDTTVVEIRDALAKSQSAAATSAAPPSQGNATR